MRRRVLVIDDDAAFLELARAWLEKVGHEVVTAQDGLAGLRMLFTQRPHVVLLDVNMPKLDGWEVCRRIREMSEVPVVMVTVNAQKSDVVRAFNYGVDDYLTKPLDFQEMVARVTALLRRMPPAAPENEPCTFHADTLDVDWRTHQVCVNGGAVKLSPTEYRLLSCLIKNRGWVLSHDQLLDKAWGPTYIGDKSLVKLYIMYLRHKIERDPRQPRLVLTERGVGYRFALSEEPAKPPAPPAHSDADLVGAGQRILQVRDSGRGRDGFSAGTTGPL